MSQQQFNQFLTHLEQLHIPQYTCLLSQLILTILTLSNLFHNKNEFPIKQLSPFLSFICILSFFLSNLTSFTAKLIQSNNNYYNPQFQSLQSCGQCRLYEHEEMIILAFVYIALRELPLVTFLFKTYRVCLCNCTQKEIEMINDNDRFSQSSNDSNNSNNYANNFINNNNKQKLSKYSIYLFKSQSRIFILSLMIIIIYIIIAYIFFDQGTPFNGMLIFQFFCPKQSSPYDWTINSLRFLFMSYIYIICINSYTQLDFKRFLILIFILTNTQVILRLFLAFSQITQTTYHQFYYHSVIMNLFGSVIMWGYSQIKEKRNRPLDSPILEKFSSFIQTTLGYSVVYLYVEYLDQIQEKGNGQQQINIEGNTSNKNNSTSVISKQPTHKQSIQIPKNTYKQIFQSKTKLDFIILSYQQQQQITFPQHFQQLLYILQSIHILHQSIPNRLQLIQLCKNKSIQISHLKQVDEQLEIYCEMHIYRKWRQTKSSEFLERQFKANTIINVRMNDLIIGL